MDSIEITVSSTDPRFVQARRLLDAGDDVAATALAFGLEVGESEYGDPAVIIPGWVGNDGVAECELGEVRGARAAAEAYVAEGEYGDGLSTVWVTVRVWRVGIDADGDVVRCDEEDIRVTIDPDEPDCVDGGEHRWQQQAVRGNAGGAIVYSACVRCGCGCAVDSWATDPSTGEQGLDSITYTPDEYAEAIVPVEVADAAAEIDEDAGLCDEGREAAGYLLLAARGTPEPLEARPVSALSPSSLERLSEVLAFVTGAADRGGVRAARFALRLAAVGRIERAIARAVAAAL